MISYLDIKLGRDLRRMKGQIMAVALVMACGLAMMIISRSLILALETARLEYYQAHHFAEVFIPLKRAPNSVADRAAELPGVARVQASLAVKVTIDVPGLDEPASGMVRSLPDFEEPELNRLFLRSGNWLPPGSRGQVLVGEAFADANQLRPGDRIPMLLNGRLQTMTIAGVALSPELIFESRPGTALPDNRTWGSFWMPYSELAAAYDMDGGFNFLSVTLSPGANEQAVITALDRLLVPYGGRGAFGRADHPSHIRVSDEIRVLHTLSVGFPLVFLSVAAFMTNSVLSRLLSLQRAQIAILKAFGFANRQIALHYVKFALVMVSLGTVMGGVGGIFLGRRLVQMYHVFFRFPELSFRMDRSALGLALVVSALAALAGILSAVRRAAQLPPAEAMRPEPPANYRPSILEHTGLARLFSHTFRIALRNIERRPMQALSTVAGLSLATGILIVPNGFMDSVQQILDFQWDVVQRQDIGVELIEPTEDRVLHDLRQLPGVLTIEPMRRVAVRIHNGHRHRQLGIQGMSRFGELNRVINQAYRQIPLPEQGIVFSAKLAEVLGVTVGEVVAVESLEGKKLVSHVPLVGLAEDFAGMAAYMDLRALNRMLGEGDVVTGASISVDDNLRATFLKELKDIPRISGVAIKESLRANFRATTAASIGFIQMLYLCFATAVACGVVYNNARISLAERARELATLRVIGFSQREVGTVLVTELVMLAIAAVPIGLLLGTGFANVLIGQVNTETVRLPVVLTARNYSFAVMVVGVASTLSAMLVLKNLHRLNLVNVLKAPE